MATRSRSLNETKCRIRGRIVFSRAVMVDLQPGMVLPSLVDTAPATSPMAKFAQDRSLPITLSLSSTINPSMYHAVSSNPINETAGGVITASANEHVQMLTVCMKPPNILPELQRLFILSSRHNYHRFLAYLDINRSDTHIPDGQSPE